MSNATINIGIQVYEYPFSMVLSVYLGEELLGGMVILYLAD